MHAPQAYVACVNGPSPGPSPEYAASATLTLIYDTLPPLLVTNTAALASTMLLPGNVITLAYSEDIQCAQPYMFQLELLQLVGDNATASNKLYEAGSSNADNALPLRCVGAMLSFQIPAGIARKVDLPATLHVKLANVPDLYRNRNSTAVLLPIQVNASRGSNGTAH